MYLQDPVLTEQKVGAFIMIVRAADPSSAGKTVEPGVLNCLADLSLEISPSGPKSRFEESA